MATDIDSTALDFNKFNLFIEHVKYTQNDEKNIQYKNKEFEVFMKIICPKITKMLNK